MSSSWHWVTHHPRHVISLPWECTLHRSLSRNIAEYIVPVGGSFPHVCTKNLTKQVPNSYTLYCWCTLIWSAWGCGRSETTGWVISISSLALLCCSGVAVAGPSITTTSCSPGGYSTTYNVGFAKLLHIYLWFMSTDSWINSQHSLPFPLPCFMVSLWLQHTKQPSIWMYFEYI